MFIFVLINLFWAYIADNSWLEGCVPQNKGDERKVDQQKGKINTREGKSVRSMEEKGA